MIFINFCAGLIMDEFNGNHLQGIVFSFPDKNDDTSLVQSLSIDEPKADIQEVSRPTKGSIAEVGITLSSNSPQEIDLLSQPPQQGEANGLSSAQFQVHQKYTYNVLKTFTTISKKYSGALTISILK